MQNIVSGSNLSYHLVLRENHLNIANCFLLTVGFEPGILRVRYPLLPCLLASLKLWLC